MSGVLYLTGTPIGNLEDISYRCIRILAEVDLIAAEDTRQTQKLLQAYEIKNKLTSYHEHNKLEKRDYLINLLKEGKKIALVTDAGMPGISDPGEDLLQACLEEGIAVTTIPGPTALVSGLILSGKSTKEFLFLGFLPSQKKERNTKLEEIANLPYTILLYEAPHRLKKTLQALQEYFGDQREITLAREITKRYEEVLSFTLKEASSYFQDRDPRGEYVLVIAGKDRSVIEQESKRKWQELSLEEHQKFYFDQGFTAKEALKAMAADRGVSKRELYQYFHKDK